MVTACLLAILLASGLTFVTCTINSNRYVTTDGGFTCASGYAFYGDQCLTPCPENSYLPSYSSKRCLKCPVGYFCPANSLGASSCKLPSKNPPAGNSTSVAMPTANAGGTYPAQVALRETLLHEYH
jgi:hypothetical protein